jgi:excisionase family DNA binding protein
LLLAGSSSLKNPEGQSHSTRWISLSRACGLLGVNESTLRRWGDAGHIRSFRTPGGHRRFAEDDLRSLMAGQGRPGVTAYGTLGHLATVRIRRRLQRGKSREAPWYASINEDLRERMRPLGRRLANLVSEYLARGSRRSRLLDEARRIGRDYGKELAGSSMALSDAIGAFTFFRKGLDDAAIDLAHRSNLSAEEAVEVWELLAGLADQVLLSMTEAYEEVRRPAGAPAEKR